MANTKEQQLQAFARRAVRVSKALWPTNVRRAIATGRVAQTRRRLIVTGRYWRRSSLFPMRFKRLREPGGDIEGRPQGDLSFLAQVGGQGRPQGDLSFPSQIGRGGRPQGAPPPIHSTPAPTMNVLGAVALVLVGVSIVILIVARLWLLLMFFGVGLVAIFLLLVMVRARILGMRRLQPGARRMSFPGVLGKAHSPNTPMPLEPPLVRVLETFDLSQSDIEHFLDLPESGNTGGYSLENWKEAQASLPRTIRE